MCRKKALWDEPGTDVGSAADHGRERGAVQIHVAFHGNPRTVGRSQEQIGQNQAAGEVEFGAGVAGSHEAGDAGVGIESARDGDAARQQRL